MFGDSVQRTLCGLLGQNLFGRPFSLEKDTDWAAVFRESRFQAVTALAFQNVQDAILPSDFSESIQSTVCSELMKNARVQAQHTQVHRFFVSAGIPYCVLKGSASASYYPDPLLRAMGDVDVLVDSSQYEAACGALKAAGYTNRPEAHANHSVWEIDDFTLELHFRPAGVPDGAVGENVSSYLSDTVATAKTVSSDLVTARLPDAFHHGLILLLHMQHHLLAEGIGLRHLCDWANFAARCDAFEALFRGRLSEVGLWKFAQSVSLAASRALGLPFQDWMGTDTELADGLTADIFDGGNFGSKDDQRFYSGVLLSSRGKDGIGKNGFVQMFHSLSSTAYVHWPFLERWKILLPFGWAGVVFRRFFLILKGERSGLNLKKAYAGSKSRRILYQKLHLYERNTGD